MPKHKSKSKVKRGQALQNYWRHLRNQRKSHSENLDENPSTESLHSYTTIEETHDPFGMTVEEETSSPDITLPQDHILPELTIENNQPETEKRNISGRRMPKLSSQTVDAPGTSATAQQNETTQQQVTSQQGVTTQSDVTLQIETAPPLNLKNLPEPKVIIARVYEYFQNEYETLKNLTGSSCELNPLANYLARTAEATGVSEQTVTAILEEREREKESGVKKKENRKRKRVKKGQKVPIDVSPIAEEPPRDTTDHHADVDPQIDEEQQMEQEDNLIETLKVEVDDEYDPAMTARITSDPLVTEMHSTVYQMFSTGNFPNVTMNTVPIECPSSTSAAVIPQVTAAGAPFLIIKTEPIETQQSDIQTQIQSGVAVQDPLEMVQEPSSHDKSQSPRQPRLPDHGDTH